MAAAVQQVLDWLEENTEPTVDGGQNNQAAVWAGTPRLKAQARKDRIPFDVNELETALDVLQENGDILTWHGLVASATDEHLQTIIENEAQSTITRERLVAKCNRLRATEGVTA